MIDITNMKWLIHKVLYLEGYKASLAFRAGAFYILILFMQEGAIDFVVDE